MTVETTDENKPSADEPEKRPLFDLGREFIESGGQILEWYENGRPKLWQCGRGPNGEPIHPKGMKKDAISYLNQKNEWTAGNPDKELIDEIKMWRSDWMDV